MVDLYSENAMDELEALSTCSDEPTSPRPNSIDLTNSSNEDPSDALASSSPAAFIKQQKNQVSF